MKIFLATSYSSQVSANGEVKPEYRQKIEAVINAIESQGHEVISGLRVDNWQMNNDPADAFAWGNKEINDCDALFAFVSKNPPSAGIQFELGYCFAKGKPIVLLNQEGDLPYINQGLLSQPNVKGLVYSDLESLPGLLQTKLADLI